MKTFLRSSLLNPRVDLFICLIADVVAFVRLFFLSVSVSGASSDRKLPM